MHISALSPARVVPSLMIRVYKACRVYQSDAGEKVFVQTCTASRDSDMLETVCLLSNRKPDARVKIDVDLEDYYRIKDEQKKNKASE